jgi:hypothetical protein
MKREKGFMSWRTFERTIDFLKYAPPPDNTVGLHHFGESLLHPEIKSFLRNLETNNINWRISTNGRLLQKAEIRDMLLEFKGLLVISMENGADIMSVNLLIQEKIQRKSQLKILLQTFGDTNMNSIIPGEYEIFRATKHSWGKNGVGEYEKCCFLNQDWAAVLWDGTIVSCCFDMEGESIIGHVNNKNPFTNSKWRLCPTCEVVLRC